MNQTLCKQGTSEGSIAGPSRVSGIRATKMLAARQRAASLMLTAFLPCSVTPKSDDHPWAGAGTPPNGVT